MVPATVLRRSWQWTMPCATVSPRCPRPPLRHALVERGPAAVAVFASKWFSYSHGIFDSCERDAVIDHAVVLLGYGSDRELGAKYWLIQNSWGPEWGESGRIRLLRQHNDETEYCGIDSQPQEGTGCEGGPAQA